MDYLLSIMCGGAAGTLILCLITLRRLEKLICVADAMTRKTRCDTVYKTTAEKSKKAYLDEIEIA